MLDERHFGQSHRPATEGLAASLRTHLAPDLSSFWFPKEDAFGKGRSSVLADSQFHQNQGSVRLLLKTHVEVPVFARYEAQRLGLEQ